MDFAGGTAVHITSGTTVLAFYVFYALQTGRLRLMKRKPESEPAASRTPAPAVTYPSANGSAEDGQPNTNDEDSIWGSDHSQHEDQGQAVENATKDGSTADLEMNKRGVLIADKPPHNVNNIVLGTAMLWFGWFGFNGGSALGGNLRAVSAIASTHMAACAGGTCMLLLFWAMNYLDERFSKPSTDMEEKRTTSVTHFCDGVVIALVAITPGAGYVCPATQVRYVSRLADDD
jgi:Amt family ammonium transporter